ncbi:short-chain dehydrogenase [Thiocapsa imhoffii]|uniref:Short-chain dehydrogenase n=1 Tax=Thiocapsa imhoffii TaxID=382777 RepID=A0A9X0WKE7_9GAMM|nr:SDR family oxidoreductase [Thiocapsa imhoffii]MBK1646168.1 short-chain dehydrogenase [Thiocapsa imhoffii]
MSTHPSFLNRYGPWALVTGASDGIGQSFAVALARRGMDVVLVARRREKLESLAQKMRQEHSVQCRVVAADLTTAEGLAAVLEATSELEVGLAVCAAGFGTAGPFLDGDLDNELNLLQLNCGATTALSWHFGKRLATRGQGGLILLSSIVAFQGVPRSAHYAASKAYVQTLAEGLQLEWRGRGIDVLAVAPGPVNTGFASRSQLNMGKAESPDVVAEQSLKGLGRGGTVRPGMLSKLLGYSLAMTPRWGRTRIMGLVMRGMTRHQHA